MTSSTRPTPVMLTILDGWGHRESIENNAIAAANTPNWDSMLASCPHALLNASELSVGLPEGQMGNSEVGHMNIGSGRVMMQNLPKIDAAIASGELAADPLVVETISVLKASGGDAHLLGLLSDGGVHSHQAHISALAKIFSNAGVRVWVHAFLDGRDTPPSSAATYLDQWNAEWGVSELVNIATVTGRYYAMDRDTRWERVEPAYRAMVEAKGERIATAEAALAASYVADKTDEFVPATVIGDYAGMGDGDGLVMCNFRADRAREMLHALVDDGFDGFARARPAFSKVIGFVEYSSKLNEWVQAIFPSERPKNTLGEVLEQNKLTQLHIAETEKYAHVTFFFNGGREAEFEGETRILIQSPDVPTYDLKPEMSAPEVTDKLVEAIGSGAYDFIVVNYANTDMVGHTGNMEAATKAVEAIDVCLGRLQKALDDAGGTMLVTADHGNAEMMVDEKTGVAHTAHTLEQVPVVMVGAGANNAQLRNGKLADLAPTLLELLNIKKPDEMTGTSLLK